jgi:hypothetical protein
MDMPDPSGEIRDILRGEWSQTVPQSLQVLVEHLRRRHGQAVGAVLFYGSCLRNRSDRDGIVDLYLLVDGYASCYGGRRLPALANRLLPPNVFLADLAQAGTRVRAKYAIMSFADFAKAAGPRALLPAIWARFSQPAALIWARDQICRTAAEDAIIQAIATMALHAAPLVEEAVDPSQFWTAGYARSYAAEWRIEGAARAAGLVTPRERFARLLRPALALAAVPFADAENGRIRVLLDRQRREQGRAFWRKAALASRMHAIPRLAKAAFTFEGGLDYALWKVERHCGVRLEATPWQRRHPVAAALPMLWRAWRRGAFRRA